jgi:hypothetical protein
MNKLQNITLSLDVVFCIIVNVFIHFHPSLDYNICIQNNKLLCKQLCGPNNIWSTWRRWCHQSHVQPRCIVILFHVINTFVHHNTTNMIFFCNTIFQRRFCSSFKNICCICEGKTNASSWSRLSHIEN